LNKRPQDAYLLIKYDDRVELEVDLTKQKQPFMQYLQSRGLSGFGGGTALNDAAYLAVWKVGHSSFPKKVVILFTDGKENASTHTKEQVIDLARKLGVEIFTIGFGPDVNDQYLMDLAYLTGGAYYHIYRTEELRRIFRDVDLRRRYYYKINFNTKQPGKYIALLQLCQNFRHHDSVVVEFNNDPKIPVTKRHIKVNPRLSPEQKQAFKQKQIPRKPPEKPVTDPQIVREFENIDFPNIYFAFDSDRIIKSEEKGIIQIAEFMKRHPDVYLLIEGHTDSVGSYEYNIQLSKRRAEAAKRLLVKYGIAPGRIFTVGYGYTRPLASNKTEQGRAKNRRIEFKIFRY
jgi:outer membrane protein OmpA-like peptidoglycan-associated protein